MNKRLSNKYVLPVFLLLGFTPNFIYSQFSTDLSFGNSMQLHQIYKSSNLQSQINSFSINLSYVPKTFGVGLQFSSNTLSTNQNFIDQFKNLQTESFGSQEKWKNQFLFLGPILKLGSEKINFELFPKIGLGLISSPDRILTLSDGQDQLLLYNDNLEGTNLNGTKLFSGIDSKLNFGITNNLSTHITAGINTNRFLGSGNTIVYRDVTNNDPTVDDIINSKLLKVECASYNVLNIGVGFTYRFPTNEKDKPASDREILPPINQMPEHEATLSISQADSILFEWLPETTKLKGTNYIMSLFKVTDNQDSLIFSDNLNHKLQFDHTDKPTLQVGKYKWHVQAVDGNGIEKCTSNCFSKTTEFEVGGIFIPQFHHLVSKEKGNYVQLADKLRFIMDASQMYSQRLEAQIIDENQESVLSIDNILLDQENIIRVNQNRFEIDISNLTPDKYYFLKVYNSDRNYFLRFQTTKLELDEDEK